MDSLVKHLLANLYKKLGWKDSGAHLDRLYNFKVAVMDMTAE